MRKQKILITGANGQLGTALTKSLRKRYGVDSVITSDLSKTKEYPSLHEILDATDERCLNAIIEKYAITQIYHLAAVLSAKGEENPKQTWDINMNSLLAVFKSAVNYNIEKVFFPSSIAVYGSDVRKWATPQDASLNPTTVYGMTKSAGENWAQYYFLKHGLDIRSLRYPGIIGHDSLPGGGTTDYAVDIYYKAVNNEPFVCYLKNDAVLPIIYMEDAVRATVELMEAPKCEISIRTSYNLQAVSFTPSEIANSIKNYFPNFKISFRPDFRQKIAESWPNSLDDINARTDWEWYPEFKLDDITADMLTRLSKKKLNYKVELCTEQ